MYQGKHIKKTKKPAALLASLALVLGVVAAGTIAFLATSAGPVVNTFTPTNVPPEIHEEFDGKVKSNVRIENQGNIDAYIRAAVTVNWVDGSGNVLGQVPEMGVDYTITWMPDMDDATEGIQNGWVKGNDGYFYYTQIVSPGAQTDLLIKEATVQKDAPVTGYDLAVDIIAQTIQAEGTFKDDADNTMRPVEAMWSNGKTTVTVNADGELVISDTPIAGETSGTT